jgi:hypothetical protein
MYPHVLVSTLFLWNSKRNWPHFLGYTYWWDFSVYGFLYLAGWKWQHSFYTAKHAHVRWGYPIIVQWKCESKHHIEHQNKYNMTCKWKWKFRSTKITNCLLIFRQQDVHSCLYCNLFPGSSCSLPKMVLWKPWQSITAHKQWITNTYMFSDSRCSLQMKVPCKFYHSLHLGKMLTCHNLLLPVCQCKFIRSVISALTAEIQIYLLLYAWLSFF